MVFEKLSSLFAPTFDWIQVEVTSACNAACTYCPRTVYRGAWKDTQFPFDAFRNLEPVFRRTRHVHLQGWGEPFLHPKFFDMVAIAKSAGCRVGTTTNGMLLDRERIPRVVESGMDLVAFSLAGTAGKNDAIRRGTNLKKVLETIQALSGEKTRMGKSSPEIHVAYMLLPSAMEELEHLPSLLEGLGVSQVVLSTLDFSPSQDLEVEMLLPPTEAEHKRLSTRIETLVEAGRERNLDMHYRVVYPGVRRDTCTENVQRAMCISADGAVSACVYTNLSVSGAFHYRHGNRLPYERVVFGNVKDDPLPVIWKKKDYVAFRRSFRDGKLAGACRGCPKILGR